MPQETGFEEVTGRWGDLGWNGGNTVLERWWK